MRQSVFCICMVCLFFLNLCPVFAADFYLEIDHVDIQAKRIMITGSTDLPEETRLTCELHYGGKMLNQYISSVRKGRFSTPFSGEFLIGKYTLNIIFSTELQIEEAVFEAIGGVTGENIEALKSNDEVLTPKRNGIKKFIVTRLLKVGSDDAIDSFEESNTSRFKELTHNLLIKSLESYNIIKGEYTRSWIIKEYGKLPVIEDEWSKMMFERSKELREMTDILIQQKEIAVTKSQEEAIDLEFRYLLDPLDKLKHLFYFYLTDKSPESVAPRYDGAPPTEELDTAAMVSSFDNLFISSFKPIMRYAGFSDLEKKEVLDVLELGQRSTDRMLRDFALRKDIIHAHKLKLDGKDSSEEISSDPEDISSDKID